MTAELSDEAERSEREWEFTPDGVQRTCEVDAAPEPVSLRASLLLTLFLSLAVWGIIWSVAAMLLQ